jgi:hypothetical protein
MNNTVSGFHFFSQQLKEQQIYPLKILIVKKSEEENMSDEHDEAAEAIILRSQGSENSEEQKQSANLNARLQYYQQYMNQNKHDNPISSDEEDEADNSNDRAERGSLESKNREDDAEEEEIDEENMLNQYAPLGAGMSNTLNDDDEEEFGDFVSTTTATTQDRMAEIDAILNTDNFDDLEKNSLFTKIVRDNRYYTTPVAPTQNSKESTDNNNNNQLEEADGGEEMAEKSSKNNNEKKTKKNEKKSEEYRSIPPLSQEKVAKIKEIMSNIKIKPPSSAATLSLLQTVGNQQFRLGDELVGLAEK